MGPLLQQLITVWIICTASLILSALQYPIWGTQSDDVTYACTGKTTQVLWNCSSHFKLKDVKHVQLFFGVNHNNSKENLVATYAHEQFLAAKRYHNRTEYLETGGMRLKSVTRDDEGNYTLDVVVTVLNASFGLAFHNESLYIQVSDGLMVWDGQLTVTQDLVAKWNDTLQKWLIRLRCGRFTFKGNPPIYVEWIMPDKQVIASNTYEGGYFYLSLLEPAGNYSCRIPPQFYRDVCYEEPGKDLTKKGSPSPTEATTFVDEVRVRLAYIDAEMEQLRTEKHRLQDNITTPGVGILLRPCTTMKYTQINDIDWQRSVTNYINSTHNNVCDNLLVKGWYRWFINGQDAIIPTACPSKQVCSSLGPMWIDLQGQRLPVLLGQMIKARACAHYDGDCCHWKIPSIFVQNCGSFFLYHLSPSPICSLAYCLKRKVLPID